MTQEEKQLLIKDLCTRLPYGVKVHITNAWFYDKLEPYDRRLDYDVIRNLRVNEYTAKPYLRPLSSMTDEERGVSEQVIKMVDFGITLIGFLNIILIIGV